MNVYRVRAQSNDYQSLAPAKQDDWDRISNFDGRSQAGGWLPLPVIVDGEELPAGDYPSLFGPVPVFSRRAKDCLLDLLTPHGELLPLLTTAAEYYAFNVTTLLDALDEDQSEILRFDSGRIMEVVTYQFHRDRLAGAVIFKLTQDPLENPLVTDEFVCRVQECGLIGMGFERVWSG